MTTNLKNCTGCNATLLSSDPDTCTRCDTHNVCPVCGQEPHRAERYPDCMHYPRRAVISTLANLGAAFTEESLEVWCDFRNSEALTNFDGSTHFCQYCGATDHEVLPAASHVSETPSSVA